MSDFPALHVIADQRGLSLNALATRLNLPVSQVATWMIGLAPVPDPLVDAVAAALGVHPAAVRDDDRAG